MIAIINDLRLSFIKTISDDSIAISVPLPIEIPTSADDIPEDYDRNGVCGGQALILSIINEIIFGNEGDKYKELLNEFMKNKNDM